VIVMLGMYGGAGDVREEAARRVRAHLDGTMRLDPDVAGALINVAASDGDEVLYDRYIKRMKRAAADDPQEESRFRQALVSFQRPALVRRTTEAIFSDLIRPMERGLRGRKVSPCSHQARRSGTPECWRQAPTPRT